MLGEQTLDAEQVADHGAIEAPLAAQNISQQPLVDRAGHAVDCVVSGHERLGFAFDNAGFEMRQPVFHEQPFGRIGREAVTALFLVVDGKVLERRGHLQILGVVALQSLHIGHADAAGQIRVFAKAFLNAAPARIAADVDDGRPVDQPVLAARPGGAKVVQGPAFVSDGIGDVVNERRIPGGGHGDRHRKQRRGPFRHHPMQALVPTAPGRD